MPQETGKPAPPVATPNHPFGSTVAAALEAAGNTFAEKPVLPLIEAKGSPGRFPDGRRRLGGAFLIDCSRIRPDPNQPRRRLDTGAQKELVNSVKRLGILQPITVRFIEAEDVYQIITGERRYYAACQARLQEVPCWVQSPREEEVLLHQIVENWQRLDMQPFELADALARLRDANGYKQQELARETGKSEGEISKLLALLTLPPEVQKMAREDQTGRISRQHVYAIRNLPPDKQLLLLQRTRQEGLTSTEIGALAKKYAEAARGVRRRGAPVTCRRFTTRRARVSFTFRSKEVASEDILTAIEEVRLQLLAGSQGAPADRASENREFGLV
jgi:ParB family chromosome partitioning protein